MLKKSIILILLSFSLLACDTNKDIGNNTSLNIASKNNNNIQTNQSVDETNSNEEGGEFEVKEAIAKDQGYKSCMDAARVSCGNEFIINYAKKNSSTDICENFGDKNLQEACKSTVIIETAKKTLDEERCYELTDREKVTCVQDVIIAKGLKLKDPTVCSNYIIGKNDIDTLDNMKDRCRIHIIEGLEPTEKVKGYCGLINNIEAKDECEKRIDSFLETQIEGENI